MRYLIGFVCVLAGMVASPLSVGAQGDEGTEQEPAHRASLKRAFDLTPPQEAARGPRLVYAGGDLMVGSVAPMVATRSLLGIRKGKVRGSQEEQRASNLEWIEWSDLQWLHWLLRADQRVDPEPAPWPPPSPSEGSWLLLELDSAGMRVVPGPPTITLTEDPQLRETKSRRRRIAIGVGVGVGVGVPVVVGVIMAVTAASINRGFD